MKKENFHFVTFGNPINAGNIISRSPSKIYRCT